MVQKLQKNRHLIPYILLAAYLFAMFCMVTEPTRDDFYYQSIKADSLGDVMAFLSQMYLSWSSRMVTEPLVVLLVNLDMMVWRIFCVANILIIALSVQYLLGIRNSAWKNSVLCMLVGSFPFSYYASAGWITTTAIYLISISLGLVALYPCGSSWTERGAPGGRTLSSSFRPFLRAIMSRWGRWSWVCICAPAPTAPCCAGKSPGCRSARLWWRPPASSSSSPAPGTPSGWRWRPGPGCRNMRAGPSGRSCSGASSMPRTIISIPRASTSSPSPWSSPLG